MAQSIKLSDKTMNNVRLEADLFSRSLSGQAEHWIKIGKAIEQDPSFNYNNVKSALSGRKSSDALTPEEQTLFF